MKISRVVSFFPVAFLFALLAFPVSCPAFRAQVIEIPEGDMLVVSAENRTQPIKLYGVYCPVRRQPFFENARVLTTFLTNRKNAEITPVFTDADGIVNALVRVEGVRAYLNEQLVAHGMAWVKPSECRARMCEQWKKLEELSREKTIGLWAAPVAIPPWEWENEERMQIYLRSKEKQEDKK